MGDRFESLEPEVSEEELRVESFRRVESLRRVESSFTWSDQPKRLMHLGKCQRLDALIGGIVIYGVKKNVLVINHETPYKPKRIGSANANRLIVVVTLIGIYFASKHLVKQVQRCRRKYFPPLI